MNKATLFSVVTFLAIRPTAAQAQNTDSAQHHSSVARKGSTKPSFLSGEIGKDGKTISADRDTRIWRVTNPEILNDIDARP
jgi:hypothetical protein